jgi:hypothetical protein
MNRRNIVFHDQNVAELGICGGIGQFQPFPTVSANLCYSVTARELLEGVLFVSCSQMKVLTISAAGAITKCGGNPTSTTGSSGTALFELKATTSGATISISKGRWEGCVQAARAVCPTGTFSSTCIGGASTGNVAFTLSEN